MSDKFKTILAADTFTPRLPIGSRLLFQRGRHAKPGDIVAVSYTDDINDFCIEPYREGVAYFAVAIRAALPKREPETPSIGSEGAALNLSALSEVDFDDDINTASAELIHAIGDFFSKSGGLHSQIDSLKTLIAMGLGAVEPVDLAEIINLAASAQLVEAYCWKFINAAKAEAERNTPN